MKNPEHFGWKFDGTRYIAIVTDNRLALDIVISFASCRCKGFFFACVCGVADIFLNRPIIFVSTALFVHLLRRWSKLLLLEQHNTNTCLKLNSFKNMPRAIQGN